MAQKLVGNCPNCNGDVKETIGNPRAVGPNVYYTCTRCDLDLNRCDACRKFPDEIVLTRISTPVSDYRDPEAGSDTIQTCSSDCSPQDVQSFASEDMLSQWVRTQTR